MKQLTQEVFKPPDCPPWANNAAVDGNGDANWFNCEVTPQFATNSFDAKYVDKVDDFKMKLIGTGFDTSNWMNSAISKQVSA